MTAGVDVSSENRVLQGDIFRDVEMIEHVEERDGDLLVAKVSFPLVVVLTQDCDLEQEYKFRWGSESKPTQDKWLLSVLVAPLYNAEMVYEGTHLKDLDMTMQQIKKKSTAGGNLQQNQTPRYHYLSFPDKIPIVDSVVDFKHYFSVHSEYLLRMRKGGFVCRLAPLFREDLSQRFAWYLARIGLPEAPVS